MLLRIEQLASHVAAHAGVSTPLADYALRAVLTGIGGYLSPAFRQLIAEELPPTLGGVLASLDGAYPGIRFRMIDEQGQVRPHIKLFVDSTLTRDLATALPSGATVVIVAALSGG